MPHHAYLQLSHVVWPSCIAAFWSGRDLANASLVQAPVRAQTGIALQRALERARAAATHENSIEEVGNRSRAECLNFASQDLRHVSVRSSPTCFEKACALYCAQVAMAEKAAYNPKVAGYEHERCPSSGGATVPVHHDVQMELRVPRRAHIAYLILSFDRVAQVKRLVRRLADPEYSYVLVHVDVKVADHKLVEQLRRWASKEFPVSGKGRVQIFSEFRVHRGGRSMLDVQLRAFAIFLTSCEHWDYYINLSDTHYPTEAAAWFGTYLWLHPRTNYARITSTKFYDPTLQGGRDATYSGPRRDDLYIACDRSLSFECDGKLFSLTPGVKYPQVLAGISAASGPEWMILSREFVRFVHSGLSSNTQGLVRDIYEDLASLSIPEETFFQTVLMSSYFCKLLVRHDFLYLDLYNAPWRTSPDSDFPFQSPRALNLTHLSEISREAPWFVRKIDGTVLPSRALRKTVEAYADQRAEWGNPRSSRASWERYVLPGALRRLLVTEFDMGLHVPSCKRLKRPKPLQSMHIMPHVLQLRFRLPCHTQQSFSQEGVSDSQVHGQRLHGHCEVTGSTYLAERISVPRRQRSEQVAEFGFAPVAAMRVGCAWSEDEYEFHGEVSILSSTTCGTVALVAYVTNLDFEGSVSIQWFHEDRMVRRSGGQIPKGYTMFIDRMLTPSDGLKTGRWTIRLSDTSGRTIGSRAFLVYEDVHGLENAYALEAYREFFSWSNASWVAGLPME